MRYTADQKEESRNRLLDAAGRAFRRQGYGGIGVDGLAKEAGVTSGAFYGHFKSKDAAFEAVAMAGLEQLDAAIATFQADHKADWAERFIDFYIDRRLTCDLDESCALQSLTPDVMRAGSQTRSAFQKILSRIVDRIADRLDDNNPEVSAGRAVALLALLSGGVTLARSVESEALRKSFASQLRDNAKRLLSGRCS